MGWGLFMRLSPLFGFLVSLVMSPMAHADSFCGFDEGLIGTKAIGSISARQLDAHRYEYEKGVCEITIFADPAPTSAPLVQPCKDFKHLPSANIDGQQEEDFNPVTSDYFRLQVFDAEDIWVQVALKDGTKKWAKQKSARPTAYPYHHISNDAPAFVDRYIPTQTGIYDKPRLDAPAQYMGQYFREMTDAWIDWTIPLDFFSDEFFEILAAYNVFNPDHIEAGKLESHYGEFLHAAYDVKAIIKDYEGREWLKAEEYLDISYFDFWHYAEKKIEAQDKTLSEEDRELLETRFMQDSFRSKAGRTVYFPYREPSGTVTMVMTDGPECD